MKRNIIYCLLVLLLASFFICGCERNNDISTEKETSDDAETTDNLYDGPEVSGIPNNVITETETFDVSITVETTTEPEADTTAPETTPVASETPAETTNKSEEPTTTTMETQTGYTYTEFSQTMYAKSSVNVRSGPEVSHSRLGGLSKAEAVEVTGKCNETGWYKIKYKGVEGFVSGSYLIDIKPEAIVANPETTTTPDTEMEKGVIC